MRAVLKWCIRSEERLHVVQRHVKKPKQNKSLMRSFTWERYKLCCNGDKPPAKIQRTSKLEPSCSQLVSVTHPLKMSLTLRQRNETEGWIQMTFGTSVICFVSHLFLLFVQDRRPVYIWINVFSLWANFCMHMGPSFAPHVHANVPEIWQHPVHTGYC